MPAAGPASGRRAARLVALALAALALAFVAVVAWLDFRGPAPAAQQPVAASATSAGASAPAAAEASYVGSAACAGCHEAQSQAWRGSQHARAMQPARADTVRGDFAGAAHAVQGVASRFTRRGDAFVVRTDGADGRLADFDLRWTFGLEPLQQYLVDGPRGRLQALALAWDTRPKSSGGQRWFRLYPDERIDFRDELHWTKRAQNWNAMCADCHATGVRKGYDEAGDAYATTFVEPGAGCESCHGPGSLHLQWAKTRDAGIAAMGLTVALDERRGVRWTIGPSGIATRSEPRGSAREIEACAPCHSRRSQFADGHRAGDALMDHYLPSTLDEGLYEADGQQRDEVFVWGSFAQSRMHAAGVTCADCHDPHTQKLRAPGNAVCAPCHAATTYDDRAHHRHAPGSEAARCVACHLPAKTYMVVDPRRDHAIRVPRPDLSVAIGTPNACNGCHRDRSAAWAAEAIARHRAGPPRPLPPEALAMAAGRHGKPGAARALIELAGRADASALMRATATALLARYPGAAAVQALRARLSDADPLVRHAAIVALSAQAPAAAVGVVAPLLSDPVRAVRLEAVRALLPHRARLAPGQASAFDRALGEYESAQRFNADRPEAWLARGRMATQLGRGADSDAAYRRAAAMEPGLAAAYVDHADAMRASGDEAGAERRLREGLRAVREAWPARPAADRRAPDHAAPQAAALWHALGLSLVRQARKGEALAALAEAQRLAPALPRFAYVLAVALHDAGRRAEALRVLDEAQRRGFDRDVLLATAAMRREAGDAARAEEALKALAAVNPDDPALPR